MEYLFDLAMELGVRIEYTDLAHLDRDGDYDHETHTIRLQGGMLYRLERSVLAHELVHAYRGDMKTMFGYFDDRDERRADEYAAHLLIDPREYRISEEKNGNCVEGIAIDLCVIEDLVQAYGRTLSRIGDQVYVYPKLGAGNWAKKYEIA